LAEPSPVIRAASLLLGLALVMRGYGLPVHRIWVLLENEYVVVIVAEKLVIVAGIAIDGRCMIRILRGRRLDEQRRLSEDRINGGGGGIIGDYGVWGE